MTETLGHRGPDDRGEYTAPEVGFGFCRLAIIDLRTGNQPVSDETNSIFSVMNGEIYNYRELREQLAGRQHTFTTSGDAEVIPHLYEERGSNFVEELTGMYAGAVWDSDRSRLTLFRDRVGEKPLFYSTEIPGGGIAFASEPKALLALGVSRDPDWGALRSYLRYLYVPPPRSAFGAIRKLQPGHVLEYDGRIANVRRYWAPKRGGPYDLGSEPESALRSSIVDAVRTRLVADVPVGAFLSGGMDSTAIVAAMRILDVNPIHTFTITFEGFPHYDESEVALATARHFDTHHHEIVAPRVGAEDLPEVIDAFDEPFGNPTALLVASLSQATRDHVKVALTGDGGDELFLGYPRYGGVRLLGGYRHLPLALRRALSSAARAIRERPDGSHRARRAREFLTNGVADPQDAYASWVTYLPPQEQDGLARGDLAASGASEPDLLKSLMPPGGGFDAIDASLVDLSSFLPFNILDYSDRMSMRHGLELRAPFVDHRLIETVGRLPASLRLGVNQSKRALVRSMGETLPEHVLRSRKIGLNPPLGTWLGSSPGQVDDLLSPQAVDRRGILSVEGVRRIRAAHDSGRRDLSMVIWSLMALETWFRMRVD